MAKKLYEESNIQAIADAIREKNGTTDTYKVSEMANAIREIEAGVADPRVKGLIERTLTEISDDSIEMIGYYAFAYCQKLVTANFPNATSIGGYAFYSSRIGINDTLNFPNVTSIGTYAFYGCNKLPKINLPSVTSIGSSAFNGCSVLSKVIIGTTNCTLSSTSAFTKTPIASGTGYIYVPDEAVETYKAATNWVEYADQIKGISELPTE